MTTHTNRRSEGGGQRRLGDFILLEELGRGGMGVVYRARQESLGRIVALKMLPSFQGMDRDAVARFRREAESAGRLSHPGIVPVYAVGEHEGCHYYAMELVEGPSLAAVLSELDGRNPSRLLGSLAEETTLGQKAPSLLKQRFPAITTGARYAASCAALVADLADAMAAAHNGRVVHRDLKPSNVLVHPSGRPLVLDFGLARDETAVGLTRSGDAVGTPAYMAPEQARGDKDVDARADIYGLGATLYELLALRPPFDGDNAMEVMRQILEIEPTPLCEINSRVPADLQGIVEKCLAKDREHRYATMEAVELDLRTFLEGGRTHARKSRAWSRGVSWLRRHRRGVAVAGATTFVLSLAGVTVDMMGRARLQKDGVSLLEGIGASLRERLDVRAANDDYVRVAQMLGSESLVAKARRAHLDDVFALYYGVPEQRAALGMLLEAVPEAARDDGWHKMQRRLAGQGSVEIFGALREDAVVELLRFDGERFVAVPGGLPADGLLDVGHYVLRVESLGLAGVGMAFSIERDAPSKITLTELPFGALRDGELMVALADGNKDATALGRWPFVASRTEMSGAEFRALLAALQPAQRAEFEAVKIEGDDLPVRNLSFRQAHLAAALAGGHLPSREERALAARGSLPRELGVYPWGKSFAKDKVAADPDLLSRPDHVTSHGQGASPFGLLHLSGNVAEAVAVDDDLRARFAGGHFLARPEQVAVDSLDAADSFVSAVPFGGVRVARFIYPPHANQAPQLAELEQRHEALWREGQPLQIVEWEFDERGRGKLRHRVAVIPGEAVGRELAVAVATPGFVQDGDVRAAFGNAERDLVERGSSPSGGQRAALRRDPDGEGLTVYFDRGNLAPQQLHRAEIIADLRPVSGLVGRGDGYELIVPLAALGSSRSVFKITLPRGTRVDHVDPAPDACLVTSQRPVLVWQLGGDRLGYRAMPAVVRFRKDGFLGGEFAPLAQAQATLERLFSALRNDDVAALGRMLAPTFTLLPANLRRDQLLAAGRSARQWFKAPRVLEVSHVGEVHTAEVLATWVVQAQGRSSEVTDWPLRVHWTGTGDDLQILKMAAVGQRDTGRIDQGVYAHEQLRTVLRPGEAFEYVVSRTVGHLAPMQVECYPPPSGPAGCSLLLLGLYAHEKETAAEVNTRLGDGVLEVGGGQRVGSPEHIAAAGHSWPCQDWVFAARADGGVSYERWLTLERGLRRILIRLVAHGQTRSQAEQRFATAAKWYAGVLGRLDIE